MKKCTVEHRVLADAQDKRDEARLSEVMASETARYELHHSLNGAYDWAVLRRARRVVLCWEARCNGAEVALSRCLGAAKT
ncbi:MAG: hypothetical protein ACXV2A_04945 [Halobacteriota archaeon]